MSVTKLKTADAAADGLKEPMQALGRAAKAAAATWRLRPPRQRLRR
jgi:hypothetical protein